MSFEYVKAVTDYFIMQLQQGVAPWQQSLSPGCVRSPYNPQTGINYNSINNLWLAGQKYNDPRWLTYQQANEMGFRIKKDMKSTSILYWKQDEKKSFYDEDGKQQERSEKLSRPRLFLAKVFNGEQIDGLPDLESRPLLSEEIRHAKAEALLTASGAKIDSGDRKHAFYRGGDIDTIFLPEQDQFDSKDYFYATVLHELCHWTGHSSRLNRDITYPIGSSGYAKEKLRTTIASLMIGEQLNIGFDPKHNASYVSLWIEVMQNDPKEIFRAAFEAEKIKNFVMGLEAVKVVDVKKESFVSINTDRELDNKEKIFLNVPYSQKEEAKKLGAKWDKDAKSWYVPAGTNLDEKGLAHFSHGNEKTKPVPSIAQQFKEALHSAGLIVENPLMDGKLHRVPVENDKKTQKSGAYIGYSSPGGGYIQNFRSGEKIYWKPERVSSSLSLKEKKRLAIEAKERQEVLKKEITEKQNRAAKIASQIWESSKIATPDNAYCKLKGITKINDLREVPKDFPEELKKQGVMVVKSVEEAQKIKKNNPNIRTFLAGDLIIPLRDEDNNLSTLQTVNPTFKSFMKDGKKHECFTIVGSDSIGIDALNSDLEKPILIAEGYATASAVAQITHMPVVAAFDSGNLKNVARVMREKYPSRIILLVADNDHVAQEKLLPNGKKGINVGITAAYNAAVDIGGGVVYPEFQKEEKDFSDWDDYKRVHGSDKARNDFISKMKIAEIQARVMAERLQTLANIQDQFAIDDPTTALDDQYVYDERDAANQLRQRAAILNGRNINSNDIAMISRVRSHLFQDREQRLSQKPNTASYREKKDQEIESGLS
ncbi:zincin-like metallopeptidase domain-containing protein [Bartonella harrusi]|uniref:Zincin-like metallopeptidase domain-containing protein n=1 Tax=Bartonella harrusi TaxID=2961895 RepID=A0ABY5ERE7_9HYPH|nr:zincin-like metallopeptidase domain-containing protein [Bartonella harrusi]UTO27660.1 zincin-like metallopeptidase domain-containing protein [Bartonella harrusi]